MPERRILIVAAEYPPSATVGGKRPAKLAARCADFGWHPFVLTLSDGDFEIIDESTLTDALKAVPTCRVSSGSIWLLSQKWNQAPAGIRRLWAGAKRWFALKTQRFLTPDKYYPWNRRGVRDGVRLVRENGIDMIWATSPPLSAADLAWRISKKTGVPFVADFRDVLSPPVGEDWPKPLRRAGRRQGEILADAAGVTTVAPYQIDALRRTHPALGDTPAKLVTNWFEAADAEDGAYEPMAYDRPTILHAGKLYGGSRRLEGFCDAMAILAGRFVGAETKPRFLHLDPEGVNVRLQQTVEQKRLAAVVDVEPAVPEDEFRRHCRGADVLLLVVGHSEGAMEHSRTIPGKLYEYFAARRPILVIGPADCEAGRMVAEAHRGLAVPDDDPAAIADAMEQLLDPQVLAERFNMSVQAVRRYEAGGVVAALCGFFDELIAAD